MMTSDTHFTRDSAVSSTLLGSILPGELPWGFLGRLRSRYPKISHEGLADYVGTVPSYRKGFPTQVRSLANALHYSGAPSLEDLILKHTFYPYALPEISTAAAHRLFASMADETFPIEAPGMLRHPAEFRLRVCACCLEEDTTRYGFGYYRCVHQIPKVYGCPVAGHGFQLFETEATAVMRDYVEPGSGLNGRRLLNPGNLMITPFIQQAYTHLAGLGRDSCDRDQVRRAFEDLADRKGYWNGKTVTPSLARRVRGKFGSTAFAHFGLLDPVRLDSWLTVPGLAVACLALGTNFEDFIARARSIPRSTPPPAPPTATQLELLEIVKTAAPAIVSKLQADSARVSIWAIAKKIDQLTGRNFASNWSWRSPFRELLREQLHAAGC